MQTQRQNLGQNLGHKAHLAEDMAGAALVGQTMGLQLLAAEMQALACILPGHTAPSEDEIEDDFDNMPV